RRILGVEVTGAVGRRTSFEVTVGDTLVFSKLKLNAFPIAQDVIACIREAQKGQNPSIIETGESAGCSIL
uniref:Uncharacterized protein n=1 Tax=Magallana gigas TaxID=29159 RepID=A0A8W8NDA3_MAGGI